jgi:hypothetical protein
LKLNLHRLLTVIGGFEGGCRIVQREYPGQQGFQWEALFTNQLYGTEKLLVKAEIATHLDFFGHQLIEGQGNLATQSKQYQSAAWP